MEQKKKKPYVKPMLVIENYETGELSGSPEMIAQILSENEKYRQESQPMNCPFEDFPCSMHR